MCVEQAFSNELLLAIIGITGTLLGIFIGAFFSYKSIDKQFKHSIKRMLIERKISAYDELLEIIVTAQGTRRVIDTDKSIYKVSVILSSSKYFSQWFVPYHLAWAQKKYQLDPSSLSCCSDVSDFIQEFLDNHPEWHSNPPAVDATELSRDLHSRFLSLLENAYNSLKVYRNEKIADI